MIDPRDERMLLLLGMLSTHSQHGYQINEFIAQNLGRVSNMKKATAYALLARLEKAGYVRAEDEREGNRPPRRVYSITEDGSALMTDMLESILGAPEYTPPFGDIAVMFIDVLPRERAEALVQDRIAWLDDEIAHHRSAPPHPEHMNSIDLAIQRRAALLEADRAWFAQTLAQIRTGEIGDNVQATASGGNE